MHRIRIATGLAALALSAQAVQAGQAPPSAPVPTSSKPLDATERRSVVSHVAEAMRSRYVFPDVGANAAQKIEGELAAGRYDGVTGSSVFATRLTEDLFSVAHDKHLRVMATDAPPPPPTGGKPRTTPPRSEGGVARADRLAGDIGYLEVVAFPPPTLFKGPVDKAMGALAGTKALIIDLRRNGGGSPAAVSYLVSWFTSGDKPVHINDLIWRNPGTNTFRTETFNAVPTAGKYLGRPVYLLTSDYTFSGGEEFAYDMQTLKLATLVGAVTGGGANPGGGGPSIGDRFDIFMPTGRAQNPITRTSWEGVGVKPDLAVPADDALEVAMTRFGQPAQERAVDALSQAHLFTARSTPTAGSEALLRRVLGDLARGAPDYALFAPEFADDVRQNVGAMKADMDRFGPVRSIAFHDVDSMGGDAYDVKFANGGARWSVVLQPDGKIAMMDFRPL